MRPPNPLWPSIATSLTGVRTKAKSSARTVATERSRNSFSPTNTVCTGAPKASSVLCVSASIGPRPMRPVSIPSEITITAPRSRPAKRVRNSDRASPMRVASALGDGGEVRVVGASVSPKV